MAKVDAFVLTVQKDFENDNVEFAVSENVNTSVNGRKYTTVYLDAPTWRATANVYEPTQGTQAKAGRLAITRKPRKEQLTYG